MGNEPIWLQGGESNDVLVQGRRTLAAIVFTDAVGFSSLAGKDEDRALRLIQRDATIMRDLCRDFNGQTIKSTGDGLMMIFASAVDAVRFILACQIALSEQTGDDILSHRLGAHLGDVVIQSNDVLGDGVNVAARLQQIATTQEAYISASLYDVVKSKVIMDAHQIGPTMLKNIDSPVMVWGIKPGEGATVIDAPHRKVSGWWVGFGLTALVAVILATVGFIGRFGPFGTTTHLKGANNSLATVNALSTDAKIRQLQSTYDFDKIAYLIQTDQGAKQSYNADDLDAYASLAEFRRWMESRFAAATQSQPVKGTGTWADKTHSLEGWAAGGQIVIKDGDKQSEEPFEDIPPWQLRILATGAALQDSNVDTNDVIQWLSYFDQAYQL